MLALHPNCEICDCDLPPASDQAWICTYECTYCVTCANDVLKGVCANCGGNLTPRPIRPAHSWRDGTGLCKHPASPVRRRNKYSIEQRAELSARLCSVPGKER